MRSTQPESHHEVKVNKLEPFPSRLDMDTSDDGDELSRGTLENTPLSSLGPGSGQGQGVHQLDQGQSAFEDQYDIDSSQTRIEPVLHSVSSSVSTAFRCIEKHLYSGLRHTLGRADRRSLDTIRSDYIPLQSESDNIHKYPYEYPSRLTAYLRQTFTKSLFLMASLFALFLTLFALIHWTTAKSIWDTTSDTGSPCTVSALGFSAKGLSTADGACRYTVRYGTAERWGESNFAWDNAKNQSFTDLPPACPQQAGTYVSANSQSEDCLFATIYAPQSINLFSRLPVLVWIHGGSYTAGSASAPGLGGSKLAVKGNMIVIVLQYRLGVLGFLPPSSAPSWSNPNLGLRDVILALKGISKGIDFVGGEKDKVTIGGQSSGAGLIRALLGVSEAKGLFRAAILQSDPMSYGNSPNAITSKVRDIYYSLDPLKSCNDLQCLRAVSYASIVSAQEQLSNTAPLLVEGLPLSMAIRPTFGNPTLPTDPTVSLFTDPSSLPSSGIPLLLTTVRNEAGSAVSEIFPNPVPISADTYFAALAATINANRAQQLASSKASEYALPNATGYGEGGDVFRETYERAATDGIWKCPNWDVASQWSRMGGDVWVGEWTEGVTYPSNKDHQYCKTHSRVCHEDDIYPTFGTAPDTSSAKSSLEEDVLSYWSNFITNLDPSPSPAKRSIRHKSFRDWLEWFWPFKRDSPASLLPPRASPESDWTAYKSPDDVFTIGGGEVGICPEGFWGEKVKYDWQIYGQ
ncbi:uncharacterized protein I303_102966 [Kwoniella dejecticola CBS 10117]|uniref:Carboxylesterase type B domain-containing protein n=1 Tax=Kwoniella dejecticola CBS 10117 TaxID=1296121 RepID=A0A1A6AA82_9TREE|nr:uncharacterized protein I303_02985 [Kwoniella dejecticola CBS 10117]OBR86963.1 hypothetical protein I303_02985 [Kwoniella dejecticola CBS 10117]